LDLTDLTVIEVGTPSYSGSDETDVIFREAVIPNNIIGIVWCVDESSTDVCDQHYLQYWTGGGVPADEINLS
jgi:hypothetical protein